MGVAEQRLKGGQDEKDKVGQEHEAPQSQLRPNLLRDPGRATLSLSMSRHRTREAEETTTWLSFLSKIL